MYDRGGRLSSDPGTSAVDCPCTVALRFIDFFPPLSTAMLSVQANILPHRDLATDSLLMVSTGSLLHLQSILPTEARAVI